MEYVPEFVDFWNWLGWFLIIALIADGLKGRKNDDN